MRRWYFSALQPHKNASQVRGKGTRDGETLTPHLRGRIIYAENFEAVAVVSPERLFQLVRLPELRAAENCDKIWKSVDNDQFFAFGCYVAAFTGISLQDQKQNPEAFEASVRTLDALEHVLARMNRSPELIHLANEHMVSGRVSPETVEKIWNETFAAVAEPPLLSLLLELKMEFVAWTSGRAATQDLSLLIKYDNPPDRNLDLALSGGGMRAAAFGFGVLMYLLDSGRDRWIQQISSVSGGSITNGFLANVFTSTRRLDDASVEEFARRLAYLGLPLETAGRQLTWLLVTSLALLLASLLLLLLVAIRSAEQLLVWVAILFAGFLCVGFLSYRAFIGVTDLLVGRWFATIVNDATAPPVRWTFADFFGLGLLQPSRWRTKDPPLRLLRDIESVITHIFTATDLRHGGHIHFSQNWMTSNEYHGIRPGDVRVDEAVRASAAFPGALPPVHIKLARLSLPQRDTVGVQQLELVDGGVRDNLGHMFQTQLLGDQQGTLTKYGSTQLAIVVDASAPRGVADLSENTLRRIPLLRRIEQLVTFPRVLSIMNQSNSEARSLALSNHFSKNAGGFVVRVQDSPVELCRKFIEDDEVIKNLLKGIPSSSARGDARKRRAEAALRALIRNDKDPESYWNSVRNKNQNIPTTLDGLGAERVSALMRHAYVLMMCLAHIELGWPMSPESCWSEGRFAALPHRR